MLLTSAFCVLTFDFPPSSGRRPRTFTVWVKARWPAVSRSPNVHAKRIVVSRFVAHVRRSNAQPTLAAFECCLGHDAMRDIKKRPAGVEPACPVWKTGASVRSATGALSCSKNRASYGGRNRTCELALNRRPPDTNTGNPAISVVVRRKFATNGDSVGVVGFEPTISGTRNRRIPKLSHTPKCSRSASPFAARTSKERLAGIEPALSPWHSDRLPLHHRRSIDVPNCQRSSNKRTTNIELRTEQSTEWDSNPRCRITGAESSPLDHQCKCRMTDC